MLLWARPFMLFLVVPSVSKMLLTLVAMLYDVRYFTILMSCYLVIVTQIFSTLFQDINTGFDSLFKSFRRSFDTMIGVYEYGGSGNKEMLFTVL